MAQFLKKHKLITILIGVGMFVIIPIIIYGLSVPAILPNGGNDWAGFWGSYIGAILGGIITLFVMKYTLQEERNARKREETVGYFNFITQISAEMFQYVGNFTREIYEEKNEEKIIELNNLIAKFSMEIKILLNTRRDEYNLKDLMCGISNIAAGIKEMMRLYGIWREKEFEDEHSFQQIVAWKQEVLSQLSVTSDILEKTIIENLYSRQ